MSAEHLTTGFYGKIPAAGDFVSRGLAADFVRAWDRFAAQHLVPPILDGLWSEDVALRFASGGVGPTPMAGIVLPSRDRSGRRFPLALAACVGQGPEALVTGAAGWFEELERHARAARLNGASADDLARVLARVPPPDLPVGGRPPRGLVLWTRDARPVHLDPERPGGGLDRLFAREPEAG